MYVTLLNLNLEPGKTYRPILKLCVEGYCFPVIHGNGVTVIFNPPETGNVSVALKENKVCKSSF